MHGWSCSLHLHTMCPITWTRGWSTLACIHGSGACIHAMQLHCMKKPVCCPLSTSLHGLLLTCLYRHARHCLVSLRQRLVGCTRHMLVAYRRQLLGLCTQQRGCRIYMVTHLSRWMIAWIRQLFLRWNIVTSLVSWRWQCIVYFKTFKLLKHEGTSYKECIVNTRKLTM